MNNKEITLYVNSLIDRNVEDDLNNSSFTIFLDVPIKTNKGNISMRIESIELPNTFYSFPQESSLFWILTNIGTTHNLINIPLQTDAIYENGDELITYLNNYCSFNSIPLVFSYNKFRGKITITNNYSNPIRIVSSYRYIGIDTYSSNINNDCQDRLGFNLNYSSGFNINSSGSLEASGILRLLRTNCAYLSCDISDGSNQRSSLVPSNKNGSNIVCKIPCGNFGTVSQVQIVSEVELLCSEKMINKLNFSLLDDELNPLSLNGSPLTFSVIFKIY